MKIFIAGHNGMAGSAIFRNLSKSKDNIIICSPRTRLDLLDQNQVADFMSSEKPDLVVIAAAKVGGIYANNTYPAEFIYENLTIQSNLIHQSYLHDVKKLLFLGSSCIYPVNAIQPMEEACLLSGKLEPTNEPYAIAKIAGIKLCESYNRQYGTDYRSLMPTNLYGPGDNYHGKHSHVVPGLIKKFHEAVINNIDVVEIWGTGKPLREFLHVDDFADAATFLLNLDKKVYFDNTNPMCSHINVGSSSEISITELAKKIAKITNFRGSIKFNSSMPDGSPRKLMSSKRLNELGWKSKINLDAGLLDAYKSYKSSHKSI
ncbi:MAG: GDP-L-fucose synthase [SAR86 cluster bacterium]|nr:GDP-L-fucose synthase [SAR86 cluster bacterium]